MVSRAAGCAVVGLMAAMSFAPAEAAVRETRKAGKLAKAFAPKKVLRAKTAFSVLPPDSAPAVISTTRMAGFPRSGKKFAILSNGNGLFAPRKNLSESTSFLTRGPVIRGTRDVIIHRVVFKAPEKANCLTFDFKFLSEEFPEFVDSEFNDAFVAETFPSSWFSERDDPVVASPNNFAVDSDGNPIRVNAIGGTGAVKRKYARGTTYDAATRVLRARTPIDGGKRGTLFLSIFDQGDRQYDSAVFIDSLRLRKRSNCQSGVVVAK